MAETLLLPLVEVVIGKAANALVQSITRLWGVDDDRRRLERRLVYLQSLLADAEVKSETDPAVKAWMKALKTVAYKADDVLDDFQYEALRREAQSSRSMASKVLSYFSSKNRIVLRHKASRDLKGVLDKIEELVTEMKSFGLLEHTEAPQAIYRQTHSALDETEEVYGRDDDKALVVNLLLDQRGQKHVQVLPITVMGGLGKTTLAKMVYNDDRIQKHFELKMWHCVSENFEATAVVKSVVELATNKRCDLHDAIELLRVQLQDAIGRKRFLLVLDDVWNENQHRWESDLKPLLCSSIGGSGSVIVVTSRSSNVASIMGTLPPHKLACLSADDSWELFSKKAFICGVKEQEELAKIGRRIVNKCKGLPLALKTMGGLMSSKQQVQEWEAIANCNISDTSRGKDELVWRSFLQDLILVKGTGRGFPFIDDWKQELNGCKVHDLMHDLARGVANECAAIEDLIHRKISIDDICHLHISGRHQLNKLTPLLRGTIYLRTLLTPSPSDKDLVEAKLMSSRALCFYRADSIGHRQVLRASHLRYLDLSDSEIVNLPDSLCTLYNLLSLRLNGCWRLQSLPEGLRFMRKLSHIYLQGCHSLKRMTPKLSLLHNLRTLTTFVVDTGNGRGIEELQDLRQLGNRLELYNLQKVKQGSKANLHEKHNLNELQLHWGSFYDSLHEEPTIDETSNQEVVLESLVPHSKLKVLEVSGYGGLSIPRWMRQTHMFQCLRELIMKDCRRCTDLPIVWLSSSLEYLCLWGLESLTTLCKNVNMKPAATNTSLHIFPKLKAMKLAHLPVFERWVENNAEDIDTLVLFPQLKELTIRNCNKLATLPDNPFLRDLVVQNYSNRSSDRPSMIMPLRVLSSLVRLHIKFVVVEMMTPPDYQQRQRPLDTMRDLKVGGDDSFMSIFRKSQCRPGLRVCLAFVEELVIYYCSNIVTWPLEELRCLQRLRHLHIMHCNKIGSVSEEKEVLHLPMLIPMLPASLEGMWIDDCKSLMALPSNLGNLTKLRRLSLSDCSGLKALPDGVVGFSSLEQLRIYKCPEIKEFPHGLLQQLPSLTCLSIRVSPDLQRRCREGGEYFDLVCSIPCFGAVVTLE
ncbi:hypothetical protein HU200_049485 [Digitaria exilis]|uniref:Uncharacterized protein n=1 Tax=Digitaria exilis TaxID=1010633 RepID=A0A835APT9_9POAL|nr:hypothetical protein HU200_049485 [Digitaria exilis]